MNLKTILDGIYNELTLTETIIRYPRNCDIARGNSSEIWLIETLISKADFLEEISLYIVFLDDFPLSVPLFYFTKESYEKVKYIPHVDKKRYVCLFDTDDLIIDTSQPPIEVVKYCLKEAKKLIKKGVNKENISEFSEEIKAYWTDDDSGNMTEIQYLSLIEDYPKVTSYINLLELNKPYNDIKYLLCNESKTNTSKEFVKFIKNKGYLLVDYKVLFVSDFRLPDTPPYDISNIDVISLLSPSSLAEFRKYINTTINRWVFFLTLSEKPILLGWKHKKIDVIRKGYRPKTPWCAMSCFHKNDKVNRISVNTYTNQRIETRTSGCTQMKYSFLVAGLGSIGSNLIFHLNGMNYPEFRLVDDDIITVGNIGRHLLGMNDVHQPKTTAIYNYLKNIRPDQSVLKEITRIERLVGNRLNYINESDYIFLAIGNQNAENFIIEKLNEGVINKPLFIIWVEPFAIGGHCIFIHPCSKISLSDIYDGILYRHNIISKQEYNPVNPIFTMQEAGCQTSYTPYSSNDVLLFLSSMYQWMNDVIKNDCSVSTVFQWAGDTSMANSLNVKLAQEYQAYSYKIFPVRINL